LIIPQEIDRQHPLVSIYIKLSSELLSQGHQDSVIDLIGGTDVA
jgi:hypothetical protein